MALSMPSIRRIPRCSHIRILTLVHRMEAILIRPMGSRLWVPRLLQVVPWLEGHHFKLASPITRRLGRIDAVIDALVMRSCQRPDELSLTSLAFFSRSTRLFMDNSRHRIVVIVGLV